MPSKNIDYRLTLKIGGVPFAPKNMDDIVELTVDTDYYLPAMVSITLRDDYDEQKDAAPYADGSTFKIGKTLAVSVKTEVEEEKTSGDLFDGEITSLEPFFGSDGRSFLRVRGYDKSHRLTRGKKTRTFGSGQPGSITEQQIISKIAGEDGFSAQIDASGLSSLTYSYLMQYNQSDWEFLWSRAKLFGYQVYVEGVKLHFKKANTPRGIIPGANGKLKWGQDLTTFEPRISLMGQVSEAAVYGWDPRTKAKIESKAVDGPNSITPKTGEKKTKRPGLKSAFGAASETVSDSPVPSSGVAEVMAKAEYSTFENDYIQARGTLQYGNPYVLAGYEVKIEGVGKRFSGTYYITKARHDFVGGHYSVQFEAAGNNAHDLLSLLAPDEAARNGKITAPVIGIVTGLKDPEKMGRVQVKYPWMPSSGGAELASNWARLVSPGAGINRGILYMPQVNDEVMVMFEQGDVNFPYIIGGLWNKKDPAPKGTGAEVFDAQGLVNQHVIRSTSGHLIILDDTKGEEKITIQDKSGQNSIVIDSKANTMTLKTKGDFLVDAGGKFEVKSKADAIIEATGNVKVSSKQGFAVDALKEAVLKVSSNQLAVKIAGVELTGMKVDIKSNTMASISGTAMVEVKGAIVKIN